MALSLCSSTASGPLLLRSSTTGVGRSHALSDQAASRCASTSAAKWAAARGAAAASSFTSAQNATPRRQERHHTMRAAAAAAAGGEEGGAPVADTSAPAAALAPAEAFSTEYKHILLPVLDRSPFLNEATRQAVATATSMAKKHGADITVVVIDEDEKEDSKDHQQRLDSIRFHLAEGGFEEFGLLERLGEGKMPAAVVGEVADDLGLDLVVLSMETVHHKHIDCNLLAEFVPCPVLLLPL